MNDLHDIITSAVDRITKKLKELKESDDINRDEYHELINDLTQIKSAAQLLKMKININQDDDHEEKSQITLYRRIKEFHL